MKEKKERGEKSNPKTNTSVFSLRVFYVTSFIVEKGINGFYLTAVGTSENSALGVGVQGQ